MPTNSLPKTPQQQALYNAFTALLALWFRLWRNPQADAIINSHLKMIEYEEKRRD